MLCDILEKGFFYENMQVLSILSEGKMFLIVALPQVFFKHFVGKNQLPGFYISETLVENGLM